MRMSYKVKRIIKKVILGIFCVLIILLLLLSVFAQLAGAGNPSTSSSIIIGLL